MISLKEIEEFAIKSHADVNQKYGDKPYEVHLRMVVKWGERFWFMIPDKDREMVMGALWLHDGIEDCRLTLNDIKKATQSDTLAEIVYAVTNEKGRTREERANDKYYKGIRKTEYAVFTKLCDRLGNVENSAREKSSMLKKYKKENDNFIYKLVKHEWYEFNQHVIRILIGHKRFLKYRIRKSGYAPMIRRLKDIFDSVGIAFYGN